MRKLLCGICETTVVLYEKEPGFEKRLVRGIAKVPQVDQRQLMTVGGGEPPNIKRLDVSHYNCDDCGAKINPGEPAVALSMWREGGNPQPAWEGNFLKPRPTEEKPNGQDRPDTSNAS